MCIDRGNLTRGHFDNKLPQASQLAVTFEPRTVIGLRNPS